MEFVLKKKGAIEIIECRALESYKFVSHAFFTRHRGTSAAPFDSLNFSVSGGDAKENVSRNRCLAALSFDIEPEKIFSISQVHGDKILVLEDPAKRRQDYENEAADAMITDQPGFALAIKTADCCPILLFDKTKRAVGAVHAGRLGTALCIAAKAVDQLHTRFSSQAKDIIAIIGPAIGPCCYEVDDDVRQSMARRAYAATIFEKLKASSKKWMLDLPLANKLQLIQTGVPEENICTAGLCTSCHPELFFSHRGENGKTGRQLNFIMLQKEE